MPRQTKNKHVSRGYTRKLSSNNSGYEGNNSNSSNSNASARNTNSINGIPNNRARTIKGNIPRRYLSNNAHLVAKIASKHNSYSSALGELLQYSKVHKLSKVDIKILKIKLANIYNS